VFCEKSSVEIVLRRVVSWRVDQCTFGADLLHSRLEPHFDVFNVDPLSLVVNHALNYDPKPAPPDGRRGSLLRFAIDGTGRQAYLHQLLGVGERIFVLVAAQVELLHEVVCFDHRLAYLRALECEGVVDLFIKWAVWFSGYQGVQAHRNILYFYLRVEEYFERDHQLPDADPCLLRALLKHQRIAHQL
jgi:hypothetical protein